MSAKREIWLDYLRVTACFMVMIIHSTEPFYLGVWTTPVQILGTALCSFVVVGLVAVLVQRIPRVGKYLMG
ncbi:MAG: hypothetical protein II824_03620 [Bacteroidales bacterium]|nr:hypothetical protein [Bacteroidales bacterium]